MYSLEGLAVVADRFIAIAAEHKPAAHDRKVTIHARGTDLSGGARTARRMATHYHVLPW